MALNRPELGDKAWRETQQKGMRAGLVLAIIGLCVGGADVAGSRNEAWLLIIPGTVILADLIVFVVLDYLWRHDRLGLRTAGGWFVSQFNLFAVAFLCAAWSAAGAGLFPAVLFGMLAAVMVFVGLGWRAQVFSAFIRPGGSPLAIVLALIPALGAGGGGLGMIMAESLASRGSVVGAIFLVVSLYLLLFTQSSTIKIFHPDWAPQLPEHRTRRGAR